MDVLISDSYQRLISILHLSEYNTYFVGSRIERLEKEKELKDL
jgi:hypothetical protein